MFFKKRWFKISAIVIFAPILALALASAVIGEDILGNMAEHIQLRFRFQKASLMQEYRMMFFKSYFHQLAEIGCPGNEICQTKIGQAISSKVTETLTCPAFRFSITNEPLRYYQGFFADEDRPGYEDLARIEMQSTQPTDIYLQGQFIDDCTNRMAITVQIKCPPSVTSLESIDQCDSIAGVYDPKPKPPPPAPVAPLVPPPPPRSNLERRFEPPVEAPPPQNDEVDSFDGN